MYHQRVTPTGVDGPGPQLYHYHPSRPPSQATTTQASSSSRSPYPHPLQTHAVPESSPMPTRFPNGPVDGSSKHYQTVSPGLMGSQALNNPFFVAGSSSSPSSPFHFHLPSTSAFDDSAVPTTYTDYPPPITTPLHPPIGQSQSLQPSPTDISSIPSLKYRQTISTTHKHVTHQLVPSIQTQQSPAYIATEGQIPFDDHVAHPNPPTLLVGSTTTAIATATEQQSCSESTLPSSLIGNCHPSSTATLPITASAAAPTSASSMATSTISIPSTTTPSSVDRTESAKRAGGGGDRKRKRKSWEDSYADLVAYKAKHGDCHVPSKFRENPSLGRWVARMRHRRNELSEERVKLLDAVGFVWKKGRGQNTEKGKGKGKGKGNGQRGMGKTNGKGKGKDESTAETGTQVKSIGSAARNSVEEDAMVDEEVVLLERKRRREHFRQGTFVHSVQRQLPPLDRPLESTKPRDRTSSSTNTPITTTSATSTTCDTEGPTIVKELSLPPSSSTFGSNGVAIGSVPTTLYSASASAESLVSFVGEQGLPIAPHLPSSSSFQSFASPIGSGDSPVVVTHRVDAHDELPYYGAQVAPPTPFFQPPQVDSNINGTDNNNNNKNEGMIAPTYAEIETATFPTSAATSHQVLHTSPDPSSRAPSPSASPSNSSTSGSSSSSKAGDKSWEDYYADLERYKERHGDCKVAQGWKDDPSLGEWVRKMRALYTKGKLEASKIERLNRLGFLWRVYKKRMKRTWDDYFEDLKKYKEIYGHCQVTQRWRENPSLGMRCVVSTISIIFLQC